MRTIWKPRLMTFSPVILAFIALALTNSAHADQERPARGAAELHAGDAAILTEIVQISGFDTQRKPANRASSAGYEWTKVGLETSRLYVACNATGRVTELCGNGAWLSNEALAVAARLPELRSNYMDHNVPAPKSDVQHENFDGRGFAAFEGRKLESVLIGHALTPSACR